MKTKNLISAIVTVLFPVLLGAQELNSPAVNSSSYHTAFGLRAGETSGLTIKQFIGGPNALEGIVGVWYHGFSATVLYERYTPAFNLSGMNWYYGLGGHASLQTGHHFYVYHRDHRHEYYRDGAIGLGVDGIFGLEYKIPSAPLAVSLDVKPYLEFVSDGHIWTSLDPGLGIKLVF